MLFRDTEREGEQDKTRTARQKRAYQSFCSVCQRYVHEKHSCQSFIFILCAVAAAAAVFRRHCASVPDPLRRPDEDLYSSNWILAHSFEF